MCLGGSDPPPVVQRDPKADAIQADAESTALANADAAQRRTARRGSALRTGAGLAATTNTALGAGKTTLGA
jgi:hypothetical protein